jgi:ribosome-binding factor A
MRMRAVPALKFVRDGSLAEGIRISNLVSDTLNKDEERAKLAGRSLDEQESEDQVSNEHASDDRASNTDEQK